MAFLAALLPVVTALASNGLNLLADVGIKKGKEFLEQKTGIKLDVDQNGNLPPETVVALKKYEMDHEVELKKIALEEKKVDLDEFKTLLLDVQSARDREVKITQATGKRDINQIFLCWFGVAAPVCLIAGLIHYGLPKMTPEIALMVGTFIGIIVSEYKTIYQYFFGSSAGSRQKTEILARGNGGNQK